MNSQFQKFSPNIEFGGICSYETAKAIAKEVFMIYSKNGNIAEQSLETMLIDTYKLMNKTITPTRDDIMVYSEALDKNSDGRVTLEDIENLAIKYLVGQKNLVKNSFAPLVKGRLKVARRLFEKFDTDKSGYITQDEIPNLLIQTYKQIGMTYNPSKQDIHAMMKMTDLDGDGRISLQDYEKLIIRSLQNCGIKIYE